MTIASKLQKILFEALQKVEGLSEVPSDKVQVAQSKDLRFGDYQSNVAMVFAKSLGRPPRELASYLSAEVEGNPVAKVEIAGPGFLNFRVKPEVYAGRLSQMLSDGRLGVDKVEESRRIVIDFSAPNVAKPMHVGHIRSTIIGESLSRIGRFLGHHVITDNHIGDWGTQFGMILWAWKENLNETELAAEPLTELLRLYRYAKEACDRDEKVKEQCRAELVELQQGNAKNKAIWSRCVDLSIEGLQEIYTRLGVSFDNWLGESFYHPMLAPLVAELLEKGFAEMTEGAIGVFSGDDLLPDEDPFKKQEDKEYHDLPMLIRKTDGGFNYATTDIATIDYRIEEWAADEVLYVVDHRQSLHFRQLFDLSRRRGLQVKLCHISFGTILGKDGKPLKTRAGDLPQLQDVLNDAVKAARKAVGERSVVEGEEEREELAELLGLSAIKFTELSHHRMSDYIFDLEKMVSLEGDTAPYLQYSYVRCRSIFRKLGEEKVSFDSPDLALKTEEEVHLARLLCRFGEAVPMVMEDYRPNLLANYLIELARAYHSFFQQCPVLKSEGQTRETRLVLCELTSQVLREGLSLLAIDVPERM